MRRKRNRSNEWEFQGQVLTWLNEAIGKRLRVPLDKATQEPSKVDPRRNDLVVWWDRSADDALLCFELKTPETSISDPELFVGAASKAQRWGAPYFALYNMQRAELFRTPAPGEPPSPQLRVHEWPLEPGVKEVDDWLDPPMQDALRARTVEVLDRALEHHWTPTAPTLAIDASLFVARLSAELPRLRALLLPPLRKTAASDRNVRTVIRQLAAEQGYLGFVDDIEGALVGQYCYRLLGQILFYFALRRKQPALKPLILSDSDHVPGALRPFWDDVRRYDYEALYEPSRLDSIVPVPVRAQYLLRGLVRHLSSYDWGSLRDDVLGAVFERLLPQEEQMLLGQFYTPRKVADLIVAFSLAGDRPRVLDPGCGSGTFLLSAYDFLRRRQKHSHEETLECLWGFDISPFAAQLAAINLFRQDLASFTNFPRIVPGDFFTRRLGDRIPFPPPRVGGTTKVLVPLDPYDAIVGNPPYLRSQNQDDLNADYKSQLATSAFRVGVKPAAKTDLSLFFLYHGLSLMKPGSRLGFVVSSSWLTADFGAPLKRLLSERLRLVAVIGSSCEPFFTQVDINTVILVVEMRDKPGLRQDEVLRFVQLKQRIDDLFPPGEGYWRSLVALVDEIEACTQSMQDDRLRLVAVDAQAEGHAAAEWPLETRNWSVYLRAPYSYFTIFGALE